jgi:hypothetical protein
MRDEIVGELGDGKDEHQVEEQLDVGDAAVLVLLPGPQQSQSSQHGVELQISAISRFISSGSTGMRHPLCAHGHAIATHAELKWSSPEWLAEPVLCSEHTKRPMGDQRSER